MPKGYSGDSGLSKEAPSASTLRPQGLSSSLGYITWAKTADKNLRERALCREIAWDQIRFEWSGRQITNTLSISDKPLY